MSEGQPSLRRTRAYAAATLLIGVVATMVTASIGFDIAERRAQDRFDEASAQTSNAIEAALRNSLDELRDVGAFVSTTKPTREELFEYVAKARVVDEFDAIVGLLILQRVPESELEAFLAERRVEDPGFSVVSLGQHPPGMPYYVLTHYVPGRLGVELPVGVDVSALATVRYELEPRSSTGQAVAGAVQNEPLIQETAKQLSESEYGELFRRFDFLLAVPAYAGPGPGAGREASLWVAAPVGKLENILARSLDGQPHDLGVNLKVDIDNPRLAGLNIENVAERVNPAGTAEAASFRRETAFEVEGLHWSVAVWSSPAAGDPPRQLVALILALGLLVSVVSAAAVHLRGRSKVREISYRKLMHVHERERLQQDVVASVSEGVVVLESNGRVVVGNPAWLELCRRAGIEPVPGVHYASLVSQMSAGDHAQIVSEINAVIAGRERGWAELSIELGSDRRWYELLITPLHGEAPGAVVVHRDVTDQRRARSELQRKADEDALTGLLNRASLEREARAIVHRARVRASSEPPSESERIGALFVDLDAFKSINDSFGHAAGDQVLRAVAGRMRHSVRDDDLVARQGGDEFVVVLQGLSDPAQAEDLAHRLLFAIRQPINVDGKTITVNASIGVVVLDARADLSVAKLLSMADKAMYDAKATGGAAYRTTV